MASGDLNNTTLVRALDARSSNRHVWLGSNTSPTAPTGIAKGDLVFCDREAMEVIDASVNPLVVRRGMAGTVCSSHAPGTLVYTGAPWRFYSVDPQGVPDAYPIANPWINVRMGRVWVAQGDQAGPGKSARYWQLQTINRSVGAFGIPGAVTTTP